MKLVQDPGAAPFKMGSGFFTLGPLVVSAHWEM
jgi:hypothetical protein